jgi:hypothetical protein
MSEDFLKRIDKVYWAGEGCVYGFPVKYAEIDGEALHIVANIHGEEKNLYGHKDSPYAIGAHDHVYYLLEQEAKWRANREAIVCSVKKCKELLSNLKGLL